MFIKLHDYVYGNGILINLDNVDYFSAREEKGAYVEYENNDTITVAETLVEIERIIHDKLLEIPYAYKYLPTPTGAFNNYGHGWTGKSTPYTKGIYCQQCGIYLYSSADFCGSCDEKQKRKGGSNFQC